MLAWNVETAMGLANVLNAQAKVQPLMAIGPVESVTRAATVQFVMGVGMSKASQDFITPSLPLGLKTQAQSWRTVHKMPVFLSVIKQISVDVPENYCANCAGMGFILASFANFGPTSSPVSRGNTIKYWDGGDGMGEGWYSIEKTEAFPCEQCQGAVGEVNLSTGEVRRV